MLTREEIAKMFESPDGVARFVEGYAELQDRVARLATFVSHSELRDRDRLQTVLLRIDQLEQSVTTKRAERWHEVYMRVLDARVRANDSLDAHESARKVADAAYPPPEDKKL